LRGAPHRRACDAALPTVLADGDAADTAQFHRAAVPCAIAPVKADMADEAAPAIEDEDAPVRVRPHHVPPRQRRHDLIWPDGIEKRFGKCPTAVTVDDFDPLNHARSSMANLFYSTSSPPPFRPEKLAEVGVAPRAERGTAIRARRPA